MNAAQCTDFHLLGKINHACTYLDEEVNETVGIVPLASMKSYCFRINLGLPNQR